MERMPTIAALLWFLVLCWVALGFGGHLLRTLKIETINPVRGLYLRLAAGLAVLSFGTAVAGYLHLWCPVGAKVIFLLLGIVFIPVNMAFLRYVRSRMSERKRYGFEATVLIMGIAAMWILIGMNSLAPVVNFDAERHHYLIPHLFLEHGSFFDYPANPFPAYPMAIEMLFLDGFALAGQQVASLIDWLFGLLMILATIEFCSRRLDELTGLMASAIFSGMAFITVLTGGGYIDMSVAAMMLIGLYILIEWYSTRQNSLAVLAGLFLGTAVAGKYYALLWLMFLFISTLWHLLFTERALVRNMWKGIAIAAVIILTVALPWYGRNAIKYHNPFHPFLHTFFTGERLLDDDITRWAGPGVHPKNPVYFPWYLGKLTFLQTETEPYGIAISGRQMKRLSLAYFHPYLILFPIFGLFALRRPFARWCYIYSWLFIIYAFFFIPYQTRYFIPYEMLMAISIAAGMKRLSVRRPLLIFFTILVLIPLVLEINETREEFANRRDVIVGKIPEMQYLIDTKYDYQVFNRANEELPDDAKILIVRENTFYLDAPYVVIEPRLNFDDASNPDEMLDKLRRFGYTHVIIKQDMIATLNVLDSILDELEYNGRGGIVGEGELRYVEFDYWPLARSVYVGRDMSANVLPAIIEVFGGVGSKEEGYRIDLSPLLEKQYLTAYASLASEFKRWQAEEAVGVDWIAYETWMFDITGRLVSDTGTESHGENEEN